MKGYRKLDPTAPPQGIDQRTLGEVDFIEEEIGPGSRWLAILRRPTSLVRQPITAGLAAAVDAAIMAHIYYDILTYGYVYVT